MERQAFTVLPPLSPRLPPPPATPVSSRIAPRSVAHRDNSAFIILAELGDNGPSGRSSPFRGRGFRAPSPQNSKIPVPSGKSAPSSPVKKKSTITNGKSAPSTPSKKAQGGGPSVPKKRQESPSKLPVTKGSSPQSTPTKGTQKRITGKPPISKHASTRSNQSKAPQPAKRSDHSGRPMPTARTRLNNKPISTNNPRFINVKSENTNATGTSDASVAAKNTTDKENISSNEDNANEEKAENPSESNVQSAIEDKNCSESTADEKNALNVNETLPLTESKTDTVYGNQVSEVSPNTNDEPAEIHKLSIEINSESGNKSEDIKETIVTTKEITEQSGSQKEGTNSEKKNETQLQVENVALQPLKKIEQLADGDKKTELTNGTKEISDIQVNNVNNKLGETEKVKETVVDIGDEIIQEASEASTKVEVELNEKVPDKDATLVEWTTKQPLELAQPQPDVIPTEAAVGSIEEKEETVQGPPEVEVEAGNHTVTFRSPEIHPVSPRGPKDDAALWGRFRERVFACCRRDKNKNIKVKPSKSAVDKKNDDKPSIFARLCKWRRKEPPPPRLDKPAIETERIKPKGTTRKWDCFSKVNCCKKCKRKGGAVNPEPSNQSRLQTGKWWRRLFCLDRACCAKCKRKKGITHGASIKKKEKPRAQSVSGLPKLEPSLVEHSSVMKGSVPVLPICLAWFCLFLNVFLPGTGTITSGFLCMCFGKPRFSVNDSAIARLGAFCVNFIVGISQIFTIIFCLVGWGWSIWWGVMMVRLSRKNRRIKLAEKAAGSQAPVVNQNHDLERGN